MYSTLIQMTLLITCGAIWRQLKPAGLAAEQTRLVLTTVVLYFLLPALVLDVLWTTPVGLEALNYTFLGMASIAIALGLAWMIGILFKFPSRRLGAVMLAAAFPNVTYLGLPVLQEVLGDWSRAVVIQMDLFAATPFLFTVGVMVAKHFGVDTQESSRSHWLFFNTPPFWAAALAVIFGHLGWLPPEWLKGLLQKLSGTVAPLMLFSLGLALNWRSIHIRNVPLIFPAVVIKLLLMPLVVIALAMLLPLADRYKIAAVLDLSMPSMVIGIVFCDRYQLDAELYAMTVIVTTLLSLVVLPFWQTVALNFPW